MNLFLFLAAVFLATFLLGRLLERFRIPWIFSSLFIGLLLAFYNPFAIFTRTPTFNFLAELGMYFLLFIIGFQIDFNEIRKRKKFIVKTTFAIIFAEAFFGIFLIHYLFKTPWLISGLVALSFSTVGEAVLIPILQEFKLVKTDLGQTILGIGVLDDVIEIVTILFLSAIVAHSLGLGQAKTWTDLAVLVGLFAFAYFMTKWKHSASKIQFKGVASFFLFVIFIIFAFVGIGFLAGAPALGALLAGLALKNFIPDKKLKAIDSEITTMAYGFFAPIFFLWVGLSTDVHYLVRYPLLILAVMALTNVTKIATSYIMGKKVLGAKKSIILGISLSVKFSTSIVIVKVLFDQGLIPNTLYSVLIGTTVVFKFVIPFLLSHFITKWDIGKTA